MHLSIVIPAFNERRRILRTIESVENYLAGQKYLSEITVVDDGSTDETARVIHEISKDIRIISHEENRGKGAAVRTGMLAATGEFRLFLDADSSTPIEEIEKSWPEFSEGADVVIGSRALPDSEVEIHQSWLRETMGRSFNVLVQLLVMRGIRDTQCGFKMFTRKAAEVIFPRQKVSGYAFDVELLLIARKHGLRIEQIPVRWANSPESRLSLGSGSFSMFRELLRIRANSRKGVYD